MCWHKWIEYKTVEPKKYYRICKKCGVAQEYNSGLYTYETNKNLCRTNKWISIETWRLKYGE